MYLFHSTLKVSSNFSVRTIFGEVISPNSTKSMIASNNTALCGAFLPIMTAVDRWVNC